MSTLRRIAITTVFTSVAAIAAPDLAQAQQKFPIKPVRLGVPFSPGSQSDVPAMAEVLPGYERDGSFPLLAPAGTPRAVRNQISKEVARVFELPDVRERLQGMGFVSAPTTPEEHDRILRAQIKAFSKVAALVGLKSK